MSKGIVLFFLIWMIIFLLGMISALLILFLYHGPDKNQLFWYKIVKKSKRLKKRFVKSDKRTT